MYKHHSYNNVVERKLQQLPAADTDGLWSSMEAVLDQQMPQKKRRPGLLGWLFAHKAWMVATLVVGTAAGTTLVYFSGGNRPAAQPAPLNDRAASGSTAPARPAPSAVVPAREAAATQQGTTAAASFATDASSTTITNTTQNPDNNTVAPTLATAATQQRTSTPRNHTPAGNDATVAVAAGASPSNPATPTASGGFALPANDANSQAIHWATATRSVALEQDAAPSVDAEGVRLETATLEHLGQQIAANAAAAQKRGRLPQEKGPYVGVVAGLDLSSVEFGSMSTGNNKGIILGYAFNNRWSVESGLLWNKKNYTADGAGFKADGYVPQPGLTILNVDGMSQVFEAPLNVKYNILAGRHRLFATAGVSSYFIRKESLGVDYNYNGQQGYENRVYTDMSKHWLSVAGFSLGYSYKLGSLGSIRVEPYVKLPMQDLGVGNMRVTSTGLNVGFTKMLR